MEAMLNTVTDFLLLTMRMSVPIMLSAFAVTIAERSGVICLGAEGMMLIGSFFGVLGAYLAGPWVGVLLAIIAGALIGIIYGVFSVLLHGRQVVVGLAINILASGITPMLCRIFWDAEGASSTVATVPDITIPMLSVIPYIGKFFTDISPYLPATVLIAILLSVLIYKTKYGLRLRAMGDHPLAVQTQGINTSHYKMVAMTVAGMLAALGGSYLSISYTNVFVADMVAGRGFMGVAANIFGGWTPAGSVISSLAFAAVQSVRYSLIDVPIPTQFVQMLPYVVTLVALVFFGRNSRAPEGLGKVVD